MPYVLYDGLYCLGVDLVIFCFEGVPTRPYISGGQGYMNPNLILA
jgi:hypothetical protein